MSGENILKTYFDGVEQKIQIEIDYITRLIEHTGEKGRANEQILFNLLTRFLPRKYRVGTGMIVDKNGNYSNQIDIVVYDTQFHPDLFSQGTTFLFPVDVVYLAIEVKTTLTKQTMQEAIGNISSVKKLDYIKSKVNTLVNNPPSSASDDTLPISFIQEKTSPPLGVIFGFKSETRNFTTYDSWIDLKTLSKQERFDMCYILQSTFFHTFEDLDDKKYMSKGIYPLPNSDTYDIPANQSEYKDNRTNRTYPIVTYLNLLRVVDPGRGFLNFLINVYHILSLKHVIGTSILHDYLPPELKNADRVFTDIP